MSRFLQEGWRGRAEWPFYALTFLTLVLSLFIVGGTLILGVTSLLGASLTPGATTAEAMGLSQVAFIGVNLLPFAVLFVTLFVCVRAVHDRPFRSLVTATSRIDWRTMGVAGGLWALLGAIPLVLSLTLNPESYTVAFEPGPFLSLLAVSLLLIPIQASTEELILRGWLFQGLGKWTRRGWVALVVTSVLFAALHGWNPEVASFGAGVMMTFYVTFGLMLGTFTLLDDGLEIAIGVHVANNLFSTLVVTFPESALYGPALIRMEAFDPTSEFAGWIVALGVFAAVTAWWRGWSWTTLKDRLGRVDPPDDEEETPAEKAPARDVS